MQGAGNDFVVIDNRESKFRLLDLRKWCPKLCDRRFGVGGDGLIILSEDNSNEISDFEMIYLNADGSDAGICGNGGRCIALFAQGLGIGNDQTVTFRVHDEFYKATLTEDAFVDLLFPMSVKAPEVFDVTNNEVFSLKPGTEHAVCLVTEEKLQSRSELLPVARTIRSDTDHFPAGTNVNFVSNNFENFSGEIRIETYERGVEDFTYACGTGAIASAITAHNKKLVSQSDSQLPNRWKVSCLGGELEVSFSYDSYSQIYHNISLKGPAEFVFTGEIKIT